MAIDYADLKDRIGAVFSDPDFIEAANRSELFFNTAMIELISDITGGGGTSDGATATLQAAGNASLTTIASATGKVSAANTPSIITASGDVAAANANRKSIKVQNWGTNPLFVRLGTAASATVAHEIAAGGTTNDDGKGGSVFTDQYTGIVSVFGVGVRCVVTEL